MHFEDGLGDGEAGEFHQLVDGEGAGGHEVAVEGGRVGGGKVLHGCFEHLLPVLRVGWGDDINDSVVGVVELFHPLRLNGASSLEREVFRGTFASNAG